MSKFNIEIYGKDLKLIAICENATNICYEKTLNQLSNASFRLPLNDLKNQYCVAFNYVKIFENEKLVDTFRILPTETVKSESTRETTYKLESALGFLLDNIMFQYHEVGGTSFKTSKVIDYILSFQTVQNFKLGKCDFNREFQYSWENENLLSALFSLPSEFDDEYIFITNTENYPFILNLIKPSTEVTAYFRYNKNLRGITKYEDSSVIATRLYGLGYGEGVNQLNVITANPTSKPYVEAEKSYIDKYGVIEKIWVDRRYTNAENLYYATLSKLNELKQPKVTYKIDALELYKITKLSIDKFDIGDVVNILDEELGININTRVVKKSKSNIEKDSISASIELSNVNVSKTDLANLYERTKITETYSQGATNINNYSFSSNCDTSYPAIIRFKIPAEAVNINKVEISFRVDKFRAFTKGSTASGIQTTNQSSKTTSGASSSSTTANGGGSTSGASSITTTVSGGGSTSGASSTITTAGGGSQTFGADYWSVGSGSSSHNHGIPEGTALATSGGGSVTWVPSGNHYHTLESHYHNMAHDHALPTHTHQMEHTHPLPAHIHNMEHTHDMSHTHTIEEHSHQNIYGIYEADALASKFVITVDGFIIPQTTAVDDLNIVDYLSKDTSGKIVRDWHEVRITPNDLCLINADIMVQVFVNSRGVTVL